MVRRRGHGGCDARARNRLPRLPSRGGHERLGWRVKLIRPLDFIVLADHAENRGLADFIARSDPLLHQGDTHGRRDYVHLYEVGELKATVKQHLKIHWPPPGVNTAFSQFFNLYWDPREDNPLLYQAVWAGTPFARMRVQHLRLKDRFPEWEPAHGQPYEDVENIRPETEVMVETWLRIYGDAKDVILGVEAIAN